MSQGFAPTPGLIVQPNLVKGFVETGSKPPDRLFYILFKDGHVEQVWEVDGYRTGPAEAPDSADVLKWMFNLTCPKCGNNLLLSSDKKKVRVHDECGLETEEFRCAHPAQFSGPCPFAVILDLPRPADREVTVDGGRRVKIDAVAKRL